MPLILQTREYEELTEAQSGWDLGYRMLETGSLRSSLWVETGNVCQFDFESWSHSVEIKGSSPDDHFSFVVSAEPAQSWVSRGQKADGSSVVALCPNSEVHAVTGNVGALLSVSVGADVLFSLADGLVREILSGRDSDQMVFRPGESAVQEFRQLLLSLTRGKLANRGPIPAWVEDEVLSMLTRIMISGREVPFRPRIGRQYQIARRARDLMLKDFSHAPSLIRLAQTLGVSERTLHYAFSSVFNTSPKAFLRLQRLHAARRALRRNSPGQSIRSVMIDSGFIDAGHFACDYRRCFGELPSQTMREASWARRMSRKSN